MNLTGRTIAAFGAAAGLALAVPSFASEDPVTDLASALCAAPDLNAITSALSTFTSEDGMDGKQIAEAFGLATFLGDLGRCANRQVIADGFAYFKKGKEAAPLDAAFAMGRVAAKPGGGTQGADSYQGSFSVLSTAGDPPSGQ